MLCASTNWGCLSTSINVKRKATYQEFLGYPSETFSFTVRRYWFFIHSTNMLLSFCLVEQLLYIVDARLDMLRHRHSSSGMALEIITKVRTLMCQSFCECNSHWPSVPSRSSRALSQTDFPPTNNTYTVSCMYKCTTGIPIHTQRQ